MESRARGGCSGQPSVNLPKRAEQPAGKMMFRPKLLQTAAVPFVIQLIVSSREGCPARENLGARSGCAHERRPSFRGRVGFFLQLLRTHVRRSGEVAPEVFCFDVSEPGPNHCPSQGDPQVLTNKAQAEDYRFAALTCIVRSARGPRFRASSRSFAARL